jgi:hypothetical protein
MKTIVPTQKIRVPRRHAEQSPLHGAPTVSPQTKLQGSVAKPLQRDEPGRSGRRVVAHSNGALGLALQRFQSWLLCICFFAVALSLSTPDAAGSTQPTAASTLGRSCQQFVRGFYDWYVPRSNMLRGDSESDALKHKKPDFSQQLFRALDANRQAQARSTRIVGLDFDPFLGAQFPSTRYELRDLHFSKDRCFVPVYFTSPGLDRANSSVIPELGLQNGHWVFVNFHYGTSKGYDLLSILRSFGFAH